MLSKKYKILLGVYAFLLLAILLTFSEIIGFFLLIGAGLFTLVTSIFVINDIKKLQNSSASRILSIFLISLILYSTIMLFYGLGNIGLGDKSAVFFFTSFAYLIFLVLSLIIGIILVFQNKDQVVESKPNKILSIVLVVILILLFYGVVVSGIARLTNYPGFCSMHIEIQENSFIFVKGGQDSCILRIALDNSNIGYCKLIKDAYVDLANSQKNSCILTVARNLGDTSLCYQITNDEYRKGNCIEYIAGNKGDISICEDPGVADKDSCYYGVARGERATGNPELCKYIKNNEQRYLCYSIIAIDKRDPGICERYFPSNEILIQEGVNPADYSREECMKDAIKGYFN